MNKALVVAEVRLFAAPGHGDDPTPQPRLIIRICYCVYSRGLIITRTYYLDVLLGLTLGCITIIITIIVVLVYYILLLLLLVFIVSMLMLLLLLLLLSLLSARTGGISAEPRKYMT